MTITWTPKLRPSDTPLYLAIVTALEADIKSGRLAASSRLPTHRELADRLSVAVGTVTRAYAEAEKRGLVHGDGRRGTFVGKSEEGRSSLASLHEARPRTIDLCANYPLYGIDPDLPNALTRLARQADIEKLLMYPPPAGWLRHRNAGAAWIKALGLTVDPDSVVVTAGAQHALLGVFATIAEPGDTVLAEALTYPGMKAVADALHLNLVGVPVDDKGLQPDALDLICRHSKARALYCNPTLHNPTTTILSESRRREIATVAEKHDLLLVEDELYRRLVPEPPSLLSSIAPDRSFLVASPSKVVAGGLRVGFVTSPVQYRHKLATTLQATNVAAPALPAELLATWIEDGTVEETIRRRRNAARVRQRLAGKLLRGFSFQSHSTSYHLWLRLPERWRSSEFQLQAQRRGVSVAPADIFATGGTRVPEAIRISLGAAASLEVLRAGLEIVVATLESYPGHHPAAM